MARQIRKVTQRQRVYERLMAGETIDQIRLDTSSDSALQRGIQAYVEKWRKDMPELQGEIGALELKRKERAPLVRYVSRWIRVKEPNTKIKPYDYVAKSDGNISHLYEYRLMTLIDIVDQFFFSNV
ncbi:MAG: hypothetical protein JSV27_08830 [Candidatus Bathyarchaeota archaeon]|nr:MAG: hypothetical protein JSV27_08830 [Candidatus Bathyarchaeota archaeon]